MYLSCLMIDVGANPDRPRPGRLWLRNLYRVHQRLCMAFPTPACKTDDPRFLKPYDPAGFAHVHAPRTADNAFLFRVDPQPGGNPVIVVQSAIEPDWDYAFHNAGHLLAAPASKPRLMQLKIEAGSQFRFRLAANPVFRAREASVDRRGNRVEAKCVGKRIPVPSDEPSLHNWLERRAVRAGFVLKEITLIQRGYVYANKGRDATKGQRLRSVRYEGLLEVADPDRFRETLIRGIGPAKAFGFGLLSVAPVR